MIIKLSPKWIERAAFIEEEALVRISYSPKLSTIGKADTRLSANLLSAIMMGVLDVACIDTTTRTKNNNEILKRVQTLLAQTTTYNFTTNKKLPLTKNYH